jgi:hydrogenase nickel incorporation protein HypA/HybF
MHEYAIAQSLVEQIGRIAAENSAERVSGVVVQVGRLRAVIPEILQWGFEIAAAGSVAEGASLEVEEIPIVLQCRACGLRNEIDSPIYLCPDCGSPDVDQVCGNELILKTMEIEDGGNSRAAEHTEGQ